MSEIWNLSALCRCCHAGDGALRSLQAPYVHNGTIEIYAVMLRDTFGLHINPPTIEASYSICESCIELLHLACQFKKRVQDCEKKFQEYCDNERTLNMSDNVKMEIENDSVILNPAVGGIDDDCGAAGDMGDSDGGYSEVESEFEGTGRTSDGEAKIKTKFCQFCNELFETATARRSHVFQAHVADGLSCKLCKGTFSDRAALRRHFKLHYGGLTRCSFCTEVFPSSDAREKHEREHHTKLTGYVCDHCQKSFKLKISLLSHMNWHKRGKDFICQKCGYAFKKNHALKVHIETVHENQRRFQCNLCGKTYKCNKSLQLHYYSHTGELPFKCQSCEKGFKTRTDLRYHVERFHQDVVDEEDESVGWNLGGDDGDDDGDGGDDSDGGYAENETEGEFSKKNIEVEIIPESKTEVKKQVNKFEPSAHDIKIEIEECAYETKESIDSPDDRDYFVYDDASNDFEVGIEEYKSDKKVDMKVKTKTTNGAKGKNKLKGKHVKKLADNYEYKLTCDFCKEQFTSKKELLRHYSDNHIPKDFSCKLCKSSFSERSGIIKHLMSKHENRTFYCQYCVETFKNLRALQLHLNFHTKDGYICDCCQKTFKWKKTLMRHLAWQMGIFEQFPCETCGRAFKLLSNLQAHIKSVHEKRKPFKCDMCEKSFTLKKHLVSHRRLHTGERPFACDICSKTFINKHNMKSHRQKKHEGRGSENPRVQCDVCGKYYTKHTIKQHMDCHLKPFKCELCHQGFSAKALLIRHSKRHKRDHERTSPGGKNTFICEICNKSYYNWDIHKRIHEKKPFNCDLCDKFYAEKITLDRHVQLKHYKERKHSCDVCDKMFTRPESVRLHKERKHNGDRQRNKKERKNKRKDTKLRAVKVEKFDVNYDSALPAYAIPNVGSADDTYTDSAAENSFLGI